MLVFLDCFESVPLYGINMVIGNLEAISTSPSLPRYLYVSEPSRNIQVSCMFLSLCTFCSKFCEKLYSKLLNIMARDRN